MIEVLSASGGGCPTLSVGAAGDQCPTLSIPEPAQATCPTLSVDPARAAEGGYDTGICPTLSLVPTPAALACGTLSAMPVTLALAVTTGTICGTLTMPGLARTGAEHLAALKQQLRLALEQIEARERSAAGGEASLPRTVEEADDLERRLREAVDELQQHRKTLEKPAKPGTKARKARK